MRMLLRETGNASSFKFHSVRFHVQKKHIASSIVTYEAHLAQNSVSAALLLNAANLYDQLEH